MAHDPLSIQTADGTMPTHVFTPAGKGPWPAVILYMDAGGMRPAMDGMAQRLADKGFVVLLPDLFYRFGPYGPYDPKVVLASGSFREVLGPLMASTSNAKVAEDMKALLGWLDAQPQIRPGPVGLVGFCMGGRVGLYTAGVLGERVGAIASLHGGNLASDAEDSPHRQAAGISGEVYVGGADEDNSYPPEQAERLQAALRDAGISFTHEWYRHAKHGWMMPDFPVYDQAAAERGWAAVEALFARTLG